MDRITLIEIFRQIVAAMNYEKGLQINSFAVVEDSIDFDHASFGKTYEDFSNGHFWARTWVNQGANSSEIKGEFPLLFVEQKTIEIECIDSNSLTLPFYFVVADKVGCEDCPDSFTPDEISSNALKMLRSFFKELLNYKEFNIEIPDPEDPEEDVLKKTLWATQERVDHLLATSEILAVNGYNVDFESLIETTETIVVNQWGQGFRDIYAQATTIKFTICDTSSGSFSYDKEKIPEIAVTKCNNC